MKIKKAIITAAGFGSRFLPFVKNIPKEMLPVVNKPSIQYLVEECREANIEQIIIVVREKHSLIEDYFYEKRKRAIFTYELGLIAMENKAQTSLKRARKFNEEIRKIIG